MRTLKPTPDPAKEQWRVALSALASVILLFSLAPSTVIRIPGGMSPVWLESLAGCLVLLAYNLRGYGACTMGQRVVRLAFCGVGLGVAATLGIFAYDFYQWELPMAYGVHVRAP